MKNRGFLARYLLIRRHESITGVLHASHLASTHELTVKKSSQWDWPQRFWLVRNQRKIPIRYGLQMSVAFVDKQISFIHLSSRSSLCLMYMDWIQTKLITKERNVMRTRLANQFTQETCGCGIANSQGYSYPRENERAHVAVGFACHRYILIAKFL